MQSRTKRQLTAEIQALRAEVARLGRRPGNGQADGAPVKTRGEPAERGPKRRSDRAGAAHELRNSLGAIVNAVYCLKSALPGDKTTGKFLEILEREVGAAMRTVADLDAIGTTSGEPERGDGLGEARAGRARPMPRISDRAGRASGAPSHRRLQARILLVDDDPGVRETVASVLRQHHCVVTTATRGREALARARVEQLRGRPFEAAILDIKLPDLSGLDLLEAIKATSPDTEVVFITAHASVATAIQAVNGDAFAYLVKPVEMSALLATLDKALETRGLREAERIQAEEALRQSEDRYRSLVEAARDVIYTISTEGVLTSLNPVFETLTGWAREDWLGKLFPEIIHPDDLARANEVFQRALRGEKPPIFELRILAKSGEHIPGEFLATPQVEHGRVIGVLGIARDVRERKRVEEALRASEERYRTLFENANDVVFTIDLDGNVTAVNRAAEELTGYRRDETPTKNVAEIVAPEFAGLVREMLARKLAGGEPTTYELEIVAKDGHRVPLEVSTRLVYHDGKPIAVQGIARDITQRKRTEEVLRRLNEMLEEEAKRIAHALHDEAGQVLATVYLAVSEVARDLPAPARERLGRIWQLLDEVDAQLRRLAHELRPTILDDLGLFPAIEFLAEGVSKRTGLLVTVEGSTEGRLSPLVETALYRIIQEALTNVSKHARATSVQVRLQREPQRLRCSIRDDGVGFDVAAVSARRGARGLGLIGIRERLNAVGGTLEIQAALGRGTDLLLTLPLKQ